MKYTSSRTRYAARIGASLCAFMLAPTAQIYGVDLIGYVPNYRMTESAYVNSVLPSQLSMLDEVRYFGITVTASGGLTTSAVDLANIQTLQNKIAALPAGKRPRLDITLGGDGLSSGFATVAGNATLRTQLATNISSLLTQTGAVAVDFDWEHPADGAQLTTDYPALLSSVKQTLGATRRVYATVSPEKILPSSSFVGANAIDGVSLMTYDIGWWASDPADPNLGQHSLPEYVSDSVKAWTNPIGTSIPRNWVFGSKKSVDAPESKIGVGLPFYARGYDGTSGDLALAIDELTPPWTTVDGNTYQRSAPAQKVWLPGKELVADRVAYAAQQGLQHIIIWELAHDLPTTDENSLLRTAYETRAALVGDFTADGLSDGLDLAAWRQHFGETTNVKGPFGDADNNNRIDGADFLVWQRLLSSPTSPVHPVPEPTVLALVGMTLITLTSRRKRL